jgi:hypothetical protein
MSQLDKATQVLVSLRKKTKQDVFTAWTTSPEEEDSSSSSVDDP